MKNFIEKLLNISNINYDDKIADFIETNGLDTFESIIELSNESFLTKCISYYKSQKKSSLNPGQEIKLRLINESIRDMTKSDIKLSILVLNKLIIYFNLKQLIEKRGKEFTLK